MKNLPFVSVPTSFGDKNLMAESPDSLYESHHVLSDTDREDLDSQHHEHTDSLDQYNDNKPVNLRLSSTQSHEEQIASDPDVVGTDDAQLGAEIPVTPPRPSRSLKP